MRSGAIALRPNWPNDNEAPEVAAPWMRPLCAFRNLVFFGCIMALRPQTFSKSRSGSVATRSRAFALGHLLVLRHRIVLEDFALEDPDLDPAGAERGERGRHPVIDIGAQRVQRHPALAIPFHPRDFGAAETARAVDANAFGAETHRRLHRALHRAAERDAALELLGDRFGDQGGVELRLADFDDVDDDVGSRDVGNPLAQLVDVGALLADHDAGDGCLLELLVQDLADLDVFMQQLAVLVLAGEPTGIPRAVDAETQSDWIDLLAHRFLLRRFKRLPRPRPDEPRWSGARTVY